MTELLTESFCERCGTRYEFSAPEPMSRTRKTRGLVTGLRQFIMSTDSLGESIGDAMRVEEEAIAARQIEAFQEAFNFCLDCRRYTCLSCWNEDGGRCRSCSPVPGVDDIYVFEEPMIAPPAVTVPPVTEPMLAGGAPEPAWADAVWPAEDAGVVVPAAEFPPEPEVATEPEAEVVLAADEADASPEAEPSDVVEPVPEVAPEPVAPSPIPAAPRRDLRDTFVRGPARRPAKVSDEPVPASLAARRSQLDILGIEDPGEGQVPVGQRVEHPYRSSGAPAGGSTLSSVWAASIRTVEEGAPRAALRPCGSCGLIVSATARFCRRCGTPQTLSA